MELKDQEFKNSFCYCVNLRRAANALTKFYDRKYTGEFKDITTSKFFLLNDLRSLGTCTVTELADRTRLDRTTITRNIKPLIDAGYIEDTANSGTRKRKLRITETGLTVIERCYPGWLAAQNDVKEKLGKENVKLLMQFLFFVEKLNLGRI